MDSEAQEVLARLHGLLDELDTMHVESLDKIEARLTDAWTTIEQVRCRPVTEGVEVNDDESSAQIFTYRQRIAELEREVAATAAKDARIAELEALNKRLTDDWEVAADASGEVNELREQLEAAHAETMERAAELDLLREQSETLRCQVEEHIERYREINAQVDTMQDEVRVRDARIDAMAEQLNDMREQQTRIEAAQEKCLAQAADADAQREELEKNLETLRAEHETLEQAASEHREELEAAHAILAEREAELDAAREALAAREAELATVREQSDVFSEECLTLRGQVATLDKQSKEATEARDAATRAFEAQSTDLAALQDTEKRLNEALAASRSDAESLQTVISALETERDELRHALEEARSMDASAEALQRALDEKTALVVELETHLKDDGEKRGKLELEIKMLLDQIEGLQYYQRENETLQGRLAKLEGDLEEERSTMVRLKAQLAAPGRATMPDPELARSAAVQIQNDRARARIVAGCKVKGRRGQRKQMGEILVDAGVITNEQLEEVVRLQATDPKRRFGNFVVERGYATEEVIAAALAAQLRMRYVENIEREMAPEAINLIPAHLVKNHRCVPLYMDGGSLLVAMANPLDLIAIDDIELASNARVEPAAATPSAIDAVIEKYFERLHSATAL